MNLLDGFGLRVEDADGQPTSSDPKMYKEEAVE